MATSWNNTPPVIRIAAAQQGGNRGAQLFAITDGYHLITTYQETPGGTWAAWSGNDWDGAPDQVIAVTACNQGNGCLQVFVLDYKQQIWTNTQSSPGGDWDGWQGPNWNNIPQLMKLCSTAQGGGVGAQIWGLDYAGQLGSTWQSAPGSGWNGWFSPFIDAGEGPFISITAAQQNDPRAQIYALDQKQQLWTAWQTTAGGSWSGWSGPNWNSNFPFQTICAFAQSGAHGAQLLGVDQNGALWTCWQQSPGSDDPNAGWTGWEGPNWNGAPNFFIALAAADQNTGAIQAFGIDNYLQLWTAVQQGPSGGWSAWANS